jgi:hypothetical protein
MGKVVGSNPTISSKKIIYKGIDIV